MALQRRHSIAVLTAGVIALAAGTGTQQGFIPHWEGVTNPRHGGSVAIHQKFDPMGVVTVCNGHTNLDDPNLKEGDFYTAAMCADALSTDLPKYNTELASCLPKNFQVSERQHVAMLSFVYNVGKRNFCNSSVGRNFRLGHRKQACEAMGQFTRSVGVVRKGLQNRRYDKFWGEIAWCMRDD